MSFKTAIWQTKKWKDGSKKDLTVTARFGIRGAEPPGSTIKIHLISF